MRRVMVIGCGGSGKTVLAGRLGRALGLPVWHLDAIYYDSRWQPATPERFARRQANLVREERWLIEGNYASTMPIRLAAADTVIFLDMPAAVCLCGIVARRWRYRGGQHRTVSVFDRVNWAFIRYVASCRRVVRPRVRALVAEHGAHARLITLGSRREANLFVARHGGANR